MADYSAPQSREEVLQGRVAALEKELKECRDREAARERDARGYDRKGDFYVCRFDRTVTDDMDAHDRICTRPKGPRSL